VCGAAFAADPEERPRGLEQIRESGSLRLLVHPSIEDEFLRVDLTKTSVVPVSPAEHYLGIDIDILRGFAASLGVKLEIRPAYAPGAEMPSFDQLIPCLLRGEGDLIASAFSITDERQKIVDFSVPYYTADLVVVVPEGSSITTEDDLRRARGAVMAGSAQEEKLKSLGVSKLVQLELVSTECYEVLRDGKADYCLLGLSSTEKVVEPGFAEAFRFGAVDRYAVAALPGSPLLPLLNDYIDQLRSSGALQLIIDANLH
jgi:polar amino acid transport system substrate-binding protein